jgi:hypothetical protein
MGPARSLIAAVAAMLVLATPAAAAQPLELGLQDDPVFAGPSQWTGRGYAVARRLRVRTIRLNVVWRQIETAPGVYDWSRFDAAVDGERARGLRPQLTLTGPAPGWATGDGTPGIYKPDPKQFGRFVGAAVEHFRGRVARYSIWNEPNWPTWLAPTKHAAAIYRSLYKQGYAAAKRADRQSRILFGELAPMGKPEAAIPPLRFLRDVVCRDRELRRVHRCAGLTADGFAHHPYTLGWSPAYRGGADDAPMGALDRLEKLLDRLAARHALMTPAGRPLNLYLTEYAYHASDARVAPPTLGPFVTQAYRRALADPRVKQIIWYQVIAPQPSRFKQWDSALFDSAGNARPAYASLVHWARRAAAYRRIR